jgi:hypothetical protein
MGDMPISNERPSPFNRRNLPNRRPVFEGDGPRPQVQEDTIKSATLQIERKTYLLTLKENPRGRFLRITEEAGGHRDSIMIPAPGLEAFAQVFAAMVSGSSDAPAAPSEPAQP